METNNKFYLSKKDVKAIRSQDTTMCQMASELGISKQYFSDIINGRKPISMERYMCLQTLGYFNDKKVKK